MRQLDFETYTTSWPVVLVNTSVPVIGSPAGTDVWSTSNCTDTVSGGGGVVVRSATRDGGAVMRMPRPTRVEARTPPRAREFCEAQGLSPSRNTLPLGIVTRLSARPATGNCVLPGQSIV